MGRGLEGHPQDPATWVKRAKDDLTRARQYAAQGRHAEEDAWMRSAGIASLLAARRTRDRGGERSALWKEALDYDGLVETFREIDALQAEYYREKSIHQALLAALEFEERSRA
jgi:hypothetical protein